MPATRERQLPAAEPRKPLRAPPQPASTAGLRPSQRRAAEHRHAATREHAVEAWLRRLARH